MEERIQKILARSGIGSRRACEELISLGRVTVNGRTVSLGEKADPSTDRIAVDGRPIQAAEELVYIALYKPRGVISASSSPDPRPTVRDLVPASGHLYPVGRLDVDSEGLILLTNDGELANRLTHPRYGHEKEYRVLVARQPDPDQLQAWRHGVVLEDGYRTQPAELRVDSLFGKGAWLRVILNEGRKRQIREMGRLTGLPVVRIIRVRIGSLELGNLKPREWRSLTSEEVDELQGKRPRNAGLPPTRRTGTRPSRAPSRAPRKSPASSGNRSSNWSGKGSPTQKPRRPGAPPSKPGPHKDRPSRPERPASSPRQGERRTPRRPPERGKRR